jgi:hypothetical protein
MSTTAETSRRGTHWLAIMRLDGKRGWALPFAKHNLASLGAWTLCA